MFAAQEAFINSAWSSDFKAHGESIISLDFRGIEIIDSP